PDPRILLRNLLRHRLLGAADRGKSSAPEGDRVRQGTRPGSRDRSGGVGRACRWSGRPAPLSQLNSLYVPYRASGPPLMEALSCRNSLSAEVELRGFEPDYSPW